MQCGKEKVWIDCVQSDIHDFGVAGWAGKRWRWRQGCELRRSRRAGGGLWPLGGNKE